MNYILFFPDELRAETLSIYGHPAIKTPNFDRLAQEGVVFEQCHAQNPVCGPSRCCLVTGQYVHSYGHRTLYHLIRPHEHNLFRYMKEAGYEVRIYGKNDLFSAESIESSTDVFEHRTDFSSHTGPVKTFGEKGYYDFLYSPMAGDYSRHNDYQDLKAGMDFIRGWKRGDKPFMLFLPLVAPHCPYTVPEPYYSMYGGEDIVPLRPYGKNKPPFHALIRQYRDIEGVDLRKVQAVYMGMTSFVDTLLGELMDCVEESGIQDETMLIASADHGDYAGDYGLVEKWPSGCEDVLTRVPLVVSAPGCTKGHRAAEQVELFDIMATIMESAGITLRHTSYARSFLPQMRGMAGDAERVVYCEGGYNLNELHANPGTIRPSTRQMGEDPKNIYYPKSKHQRERPESVGRTTMIRTLSYKMILRSYEDNELYDLKNDPLELCNVFGGHDYTAVQSDLQCRMLDWYIATSDSVPMEEDSRW
jgi:choline-sulfatase